MTTGTANTSSFRGGFNRVHDTIMQKVGVTVTRNADGTFDNYVSKPLGTRPLSYTIASGAGLAGGIAYGAMGLGLALKDTLGDMLNSARATATIIKDQTTHTASQGWENGYSLKDKIADTVKKKNSFIKTPINLVGTGLGYMAGGAMGLGGGTLGLNIAISKALLAGMGIKTTDESKNGDLTNENTEYKEALKIANYDSSKFSDQLKAKNSKYKTLMDKNITLQESKQHILIKYTALYKKLEETSTSLTDMTANHGALNYKNQGLEQQLKEVNTENQGLKNETTEQKVQIQKITRELVSSQLQALDNSKLIQAVRSANLKNMTPKSTAEQSTQTQSQPTRNIAKIAAKIQEKDPWKAIIEFAKKRERATTTPSG